MTFEGAASAAMQLLAQPGLVRAQRGEFRNPDAFLRN